ncbi:MAG: hypothetical protein SFU83_14290 [Meiothermus sp.]|nr:hypothetical protein [Meiothermus sp.]
MNRVIALPNKSSRASRPLPMGGSRLSLRNWLLPAPIEFSGYVAPRHLSARPVQRHTA